MQIALEIYSLYALGTYKSVERLLSALSASGTIRRTEAARLCHCLEASAEGFCPVFFLSLFVCLYYITSKSESQHLAHIFYVLYAYI